MKFSTIYEFTKSVTTPLLIEYFYKGEKIQDPAAFFEEHDGQLEFAFPSLEETQLMIDKYVIYHQTNKLVISEHGFHLVFL